jgi:hypothetical protein
VGLDRQGYRNSGSAVGVEARMGCNKQAAEEGRRAEEEPKMHLSGVTNLSVNYEFGALVCRPAVLAAPRPRYAVRGPGGPDDSRPGGRRYLFADRFQSSH